MKTLPLSRLDHVKFRVKRILRRLNFSLSRLPFVRYPFRFLRGLFLRGRKWNWEIHDWVMDGTALIEKEFHPDVEIRFSEEGPFIKTKDGFEYGFDVYPGTATLYSVLKGKELIIPEEINLIIRNLKPKSLVFDVGAAIGVYALNIAKGVVGAQIHCFEPTGSNYETLVSNVKRNKMENRIFCHRSALADRKGNFDIAPVGTGSYLYIGSDSRNGFSADERVQTTTLDDFVSKHKMPRLDFIKVDVEGAELLVLKGAEKCLNLHKPNLLLEITEECPKRFGYSYGDVFKYLNHLGYNYVIVAEARDEILKPGTLPLEEQVKMAYNFFFYHKTKPFKLN